MNEVFEKRGEAQIALIEEKCSRQVSIDTSECNHIRNNLIFKKCLAQLKNQQVSIHLSKWSDI